MKSHVFHNRKTCVRLSNGSTFLDGVKLFILKLQKVVIKGNVDKKYVRKRFID